MTMRKIFPSVNGLFVTGTDTGVGKTLVTGAIAQHLRTCGLRVGVFKPVATGVLGQGEHSISIDARFLAHCSRSEHSLEQINPVRYRQPVAPAVAAEQTGRSIDWQRIRQAYIEIVESSHVTLVEGVGGVMVPLDREFLVLDLMVVMGLPVLIVARSTLGTINHTLLTVEACRNRGLSIVGIIMNGYGQGKPTLDEQTSPQMIADLCRERIISIIPHDANSCVESNSLGPKVIKAVAGNDWIGTLKVNNKSIG